MEAPEPFRLGLFKHGLTNTSQRAQGGVILKRLISNPNPVRCYPVVVVHEAYKIILGLL
jgi:hypothetical protein